ncbi:two-component system CheB/CheR fusion protein [Natronocella acetinitrilica]|uniref:Two-component system CheB/CheR fusion protein n=1 Tax=Natronocella acetinitrilica TaxID=414046 RepID=A0AAE3G560_9GAMM|nr:chemotaxis protein CheB [Natronocella acetinitrilica]MCP1675572.1 two-component system CheB/CheR fusion protein [Natronocella acetinitrilica]
MTQQAEASQSGKNTATELVLVGIGASAGGLEALRSLVNALRPDEHLAFVVAQHLSPTHQSMLVQLLARETTLPVIQVEDGMLPQPSTIHITPANSNIVVDDGLLRLSQPEERPVPKPSVDAFFRSLADAFGEHAVGVVLSGTGTDGSHGIRAIKSSGGFTFAQTPANAKYDGMPRAAIDTGCVDFVMEPAAIATELMRITTLSRDVELPSGSSPLPPVYERIARLVQKRGGLDLSAYKDKTVQRRLRRRLAANHVNALEDYEQLLRQNPEEVDRLAREILISVTSFFRDPEAFRALEAPLMELLERKPLTEDIRIWVPGCATGEEAYSLAIMLCELTRGTMDDVRVQVFATDLDAQALGVARRGIYDESSFNDMPTDLIERYFEHRGGQYKVTKRLRDMLVFARQNLLQDPPFLRLDLVSCRNLLIYFNQSAQQRLFETFHYALNPGGLLFLGKSEAATRHEQLFASVHARWRVYRRHGGAPNSAGARYRSYRPGRNELAEAVEPPAPRRPSVYDRMIKVALEHYAPASLLVDEKLTIHHLLGDVSRYLRFPSGEPDFSLRNLARREMRVDLAALITRVKKERRNVSSRVIRLGPDEESVRVTVHPVAASADDSLLFLISFEAMRPQPQGTAEASDIVPDEADRRIRELEDELAATREHLQTVIEELETTNEELQSSNEELQSSNEELQSSNEELETTNEELQSSNEELTTVNEELNSKTIELNAAYSDLENVKDSLADALIVVDEKLRIKFYNPACERIFSLGPENFGTLLPDVERRIDLPRFSQRLKQVVTKGEAVEVQITHSVAVTEEGDNTTSNRARYYLLRMRPYYDQNRSIRGAVITFFDNTRIKQAERSARESEARLHAILDHSPLITALKDPHGRYLYANRAAAHVFDREPDAMIGLTEADLLPAQEADRIAQREHEAVANRKLLEDVETMTIDGRERSFIVVRFPLFDEEDKLYALCVKALDITERLHAEQQVRLQSKALDASMDGILIADARAGDRPIVYANPAFSRITGYPEETVLGRNCRFLQGPDTDPESLNEIRQALDEGRPGRALLRNYRKSGEAFWNELSVFPVHDDNEQLTHFVGIQEDVTHRVETEQALRANQERLSKAQEFARVVHFEWTTDASGRLTAGDGLRELFDLPADAALQGRKLLRQIPAQDRHALLRALGRCLREGVELNLEFRLTHETDERWLHARAHTLRDKERGVTRMLGLVQDITLRKAVEQALVAARLEAESANRAKSEFLSHMSHELRTPLNAVLGFAQLLEADDEQPLSENQQQQVAQILSAGWHLLDLISEILDLAKIESGRLQMRRSHVRPSDIASNCLGTVSQMAKEYDVTLQADVTDDELIDADATRLTQVLLNLLTNAIKYNRPGGTVELQVHQDNRNCVFTVRDTGLGIPEHRRNELFQAFNRLGREGGRIQGTGIGLVVCRRMVELMGGTISVESEETVGSAFSVTLPHALDSGAVHAPAETKAAPPTSRPADVSDIRRVLYIEDNESNRLLARQIFQRQKHLELLEARDAESGIVMAQTESPDLILMDLHLPGMDGFQALEVLRGNSVTANIPVVAVSADVAETTAQRILQAGFSEHLVKPLTLNGLLEALRIELPR